MIQHVSETMTDDRRRGVARDALERVCSGSDPSAAAGVYSGRSIKTWGVVISTIEDGEIIEDRAPSDSLEIVRQLGIRRSLLLGLDYLRRR